MNNLVCILSVLATIVSYATARNASTTFLNQWPMIMAHDAATTYLTPGIINNWAKTQPSGGMFGLLACGARAFDWRPTLAADGTVYMHHSAVVIKVPMAQAMDDLVRWANQNNSTSPHDLIVLSVVDCTLENKASGNCVQAVEQLLAARNITIVSRSDLQTMTAQQATQRAKHVGGGAVLACVNCVVDHYNPAVTCAGFGGGTAEESLIYTCYNDSSTKAYPLNRMWEYIHNVSTVGPPLDGSFYTTQTLWQESASDVTIGELHGSDLLKDESKSQLNLLLKDRITSGLWNVTRVGLVEINNVCDGGVALKRVLDGLP